jgi:nucleotide-binding universal stress UspA family protein
MTIRRILFPVDFSERAKAVAPYVLSLAQRHKAPVVLMNVIQPPAPLYGGINMVYPETFDYTEARVAVSGSLAEFGAAELPKVDVISVVDIGDPASLIIDYADDNGVDLICLPTHGYGTFRRLLLGSVTAKVLHDAQIPVWTSAHAPEASHRAHPQPRHVIVAIEPDTRAREILDAAVAVTKESGATLDIVTAVSQGSVFGPGVLGPAVADAELEKLLIDGTGQVLAKLQAEAGTEAGMVIEIGSPAFVVRRAALSKRADLVVVGRGKAHDSYAIIREAPCPVLSV